MLVQDIPGECKFEVGSTVTVITSLAEEKCLNRSRKQSHTGKNFSDCKVSKSTQGVFCGIVLEETVINLRQDTLWEINEHKENQSSSKRDKHLLILSLLKPSLPFRAGQIVWIMVDQITAIITANHQ